MEFWGYNVIYVSTTIPRCSKRFRTNVMFERILEDFISIVSRTIRWAIGWISNESTIKRYLISCSGPTICLRGISTFVRSPLPRQHLARMIFKYSETLKPCIHENLPSEMLNIFPRNISSIISALLVQSSRLFNYPWRAHRKFHPLDYRYISFAIWYTLLPNHPARKFTCFVE